MKATQKSLKLGGGGSEGGDTQSTAYLRNNYV